MKKLFTLVLLILFSSILFAQKARVSGKVTCPHCGVEVMTVTKTVAGKFAYLSCIVLGFLTFCCCIPFCVDGFKDVEHKCPRCSNTIAIFERL